MICKKCGYELPDLTMYCTNCGAPQFEAPKTEAHLVMPSGEKCSVVINSVPNMTTAITQIRALTGLGVPEIRKLLQTLPAVLLEKLSLEEAQNTVSLLKENGVDAIVDDPAAQEPVSVEEPVQEEEPVPEEEVIEEQQEEIPEETVEEPVEEKVSDEDFDAQMNAFLNEGEQETAEEAAEVQEEIAEEDVEEAIEEPAEEEPAEEEEGPKEYVPELTLEPNIMSDDSFMKEMEEFLNGKKD